MKKYKVTSSPDSSQRWLSPKVKEDVNPDMGDILEIRVTTFRDDGLFKETKQTHAWEGPGHTFSEVSLVVLPRDSGRTGSGVSGDYCQK